MDILLWIVLVNLLPMMAVGAIALRRAHFAIPWLGLTTVVIATYLSFSSSAILVNTGSIGAGIGWPIAALYGLIGIGIVLAYAHFRPVPFVPLGEIVVGSIYVWSFYAYLPPFSDGLPGMLIFAVPGLALGLHGVYLWYRRGLAGTQDEAHKGLRLALALAGVAGLTAIGVHAYWWESDNEQSNPWFAVQPDLSRLTTDSALVMEGVVSHKESIKQDYRRPNGRSASAKYTLYRIDSTHTWHGTPSDLITFVVNDYSPVDLMPGETYLLFLSRKASRDGFPEDRFPGYWRIIAPSRVWMVRDNGFHPHAGFSPSTPITREALADALAAIPDS